MQTLAHMVIRLQRVRVNQIYLYLLFTETYEKCQNQTLPVDTSLEGGVPRVVTVAFSMKGPPRARNWHQEESLPGRGGLRVSDLTFNLPKFGTVVRIHHFRCQGRAVWCQQGL